MAAPNKFARTKAFCKPAQRSVNRLFGVMPALVAGTHVFLAGFHIKAWMAGTSPAMTPNNWFNTTATRYSPDEDALHSPPRVG